MAPEIISNLPYSYSADIWSLGILMFELCESYNPMQRAIDGNKKFISNFTIPRLSDRYSDKMNILLLNLLKAEPKSRLKAKEILSLPMFIACIFLNRFSERKKTTNDIICSQINRNYRCRSN